MKQLMAVSKHPKPTFHYDKIVPTLNDLISNDSILQNLKVCNNFCTLQQNTIEGLNHGSF